MTTLYQSALSIQDFVWFVVAIFICALLVPLAKSTWLFWRQELFIESIAFVLLEIRIPREIRKSPKAMEQALAALHALRNAPGDFREKWWDGEITRWYSLEIISFGGEVHFYMRVYKKQRDLIEATFYSYYQDIELVEVDDYADRLPKTVGELYQRGYDLWGSELTLDRKDAYPIKSYLDFEAVAEEKEYDPISIFLEVLSKVKKEEFFGIQILIQPADLKWKDKFKELVEELRTKEDPRKAKAKKAGYERKIMFEGIFPHFPIGKGEEKKDEFGFTKSFLRTPGETDVLKAVEENLSMPAFKTLVRFVYLSPKEMFYDTFARRGVMSAFNQYASLDLNSFKRNEQMSTRTRIWHWPHILPATRNEYKKQRLLIHYLHRTLPQETFMGKIFTSHIFNWNFDTRQFLLTTRSLASLYHPPTLIVLTAPHLKRVESRKMSPPAGLSIYGGEEEIEKFK